MRRIVQLLFVCDDETAKCGWIESVMCELFVFQKSIKLDIHCEDCITAAETYRQFDILIYYINTRKL